MASQRRGASRCGLGVAVVDSAATTAAQVARILDHGASVVADGNTIARVPAAMPSLLTCLATDNAERFARVGARFLGESLEVSQVEVIDI